jgi:hypothetical protein
LNWSKDLAERTVTCNVFQRRTAVHKNEFLKALKLYLGNLRTKLSFERVALPWDSDKETNEDFKYVGKFG